MESLSRPPHRRKQFNSFSLNNPYDDDLLSNGGKKKPFEAHEYSEIFSGSSSIPVLDLSGLDEPVGSGDGRSSFKLDYTNIFGGLRNDEVAVPYEEVVSGSSAKKTKPRIQTDVRPPSQESGSPHCSGKTNRSSPELSDQSVDGLKQQVNMSFNRTGQRDNDASNGKTHIAQLHAAPGFTYFVDGTSRLQKTEDERNIPSLKRGVSRAWSFSAELKGNLSGNKSHMPDKSLDDDNVNLKPHFLNVPPSDDNDPRRSRASDFVSKQDASEKIAGESSPSFFDEEFDENSVAAVSSAALKKAIDHAQESIRIAKMIMDRKKLGLQDGSKRSSRGCLKVKNKKEATIDHEAYSSKKKIVRENNERSDLFNAGKVDAERVRENVGAAKEHAEAFIREGQISAPSCSQRETLQFEQRTVNVGHMKWHDFVHKQSERALDTPKRMEEPDNSVEEALEQCQATFDHAKVRTHIDEREKIVDETCENLRIIQENEVGKENEMVTANKETGEKKFEEYTEMLNESVNLVEKEKVEQEEMGKDETVTEWNENGLRHGESDNEEVNVMGQKEDHMWFQSEEELKKALDEEINERKSENLPEINDKKQNLAYDENELMLPEILEQDEAEERHVNIYEDEATETVVLEANNIVEAQQSEVLRDAEETNTVNEENHSKCDYEEFAYEKDIDEAVDANSSDASTVFSESQEACDVDLTNEPGQLFHLEDNEMPEIDSLRRSASEEIFSESKLHDPFEGPSANAKTENFDDIEEKNEENLSDEDTLERICEINDASQEYTNKIDGQNLPQVDSSDNKTEEFDLAYLRQVLEQTLESDEGSTSTSSAEKYDALSAHESEECVENAKEMTSNEEKLKYEIDTASNEAKCNEERSEEMDKHMETERGVEKDLNVETNHAKENVQNFYKNDHQQRIEAIRRGREREKDRIAVERAIREARERAFAEAREKAERAAREKLEKVNKQTADKASIEAKLRAERAAVERATAEARERALEKAMSQKTFTEAKTQADKYPVERILSSSRNNGLKHSFSSSDLDKLDGSNVESAQRRKARLERHQRIMERAAKALAEKNMRDLLAQKEQAERNRLAESLDADIKRWATGKEGNLRALLSTLQYILGAENGWQPIPLTEIITTAAVKKAYRKATLYVHPDKLQQRGATIQQKYICEKVFDLLKAAWNRFNSEER